jgi:hypothetical protein
MMFRAVMLLASFPAGKVTTVWRAVITAVKSAAVRAADAEIGASVSATGMVLFVWFLSVRLFCFISP